MSGESSNSLLRRRGVELRGEVSILTIQLHAEQDASRQVRAEAMAALRVLREGMDGWSSCGTNDCGACWVCRARAVLDSDLSVMGRLLINVISKAKVLRLRDDEGRVYFAAMPLDSEVRVASDWDAEKYVDLCVTLELAKQELYTALRDLESVEAPHVVAVNENPGESDG